MKIHFLGTCSGTEPMPGMHHCSLVMEVNGINYWFDAGETCSYTAYLSGLDMQKTKALFVSHPHIDHIGGMANLNLRFNHHGRVIINDRPAVERLAAEYSAKGSMSVKICYDDMVEEF